MFLIAAGTCVYSTCEETKIMHIIAAVTIFSDHS
jgi:hypothetical protein